MGTSAGPSLQGIGRGGDSNLVLEMDAHDAKSYPGEPTTNLQANGVYTGFENNSTSGWSWDAKTDGAFSVISSDSHSGKYCAKLTNSTVSSIALWKDITITSGVTYTWTVWVKNISCPTTPNFSSAGVSVSTVSGGSNFTGISDEWQRFHWTFTASSTGTFSPYIRTGSNAAQGYFLVDDIQIEEKAYATPYVQEIHRQGLSTGTYAARPATTNLMIHGNVGTGQSFSDSSPSGHTITAGGNTTHSAAQSKFSGGSIYFDGADDYLSVANHTDFAFGAGDFTVDAWIYGTDAAQNEQTIFAKDFATDYGWIFNFATGSGNGYDQIGFLYSTNGSSWASTTRFTSGVTANTWHHIAAVRSGTTITVYVDGTSVGSLTGVGTFNADGAAFLVGAYQSGSVSGDFDGYIDEVRVTKGTALWLSAFTPPTRRNLSAPVVDRSGNDNGGNFATKETTDVATYRVGEVIEPIASAVWDFDGTDDYMRGGPPAGQVGSTTAKTYEYWFKLNSSHTSSNGMLSMQSDDANNYKWQYVYVATNTHLQFMYGDNSGYNLYGACSAGITADVWTCIVMSIDVSRAANDRLQIYRNGEPQTVSWNGTYTSKNAFYDGADLRQYIGAWNHASPPSPSTFLDGQMGKVSIWKIGLTAQQVKENFNQQRSRFGV